MRSLRWAVVVLGVTAWNCSVHANDWVQRRGDPGFTGFSSVSLPSLLQPRWTITGIVGEPIVSGCHIFVRDTSGSLTRRAIFDGGVEWATPALGVTTRQAGIGEGRVYVASMLAGGEFQAFDADTGERLWAVTHVAGACSVTANWVHLLAHEVSVPAPGIVTFCSLQGQLGVGADSMFDPEWKVLNTADGSCLYAMNYFVGVT